MIEQREFDHEDFANVPSQFPDEWLIGDLVSPDGPWSVSSLFEGNADYTVLLSLTDMRGTSIRMTPGEALRMAHGLIVMAGWSERDNRIRNQQ